MQYPRIRGNKILSIDIETYDPELKDGGPGVYRSIPLDFRNAHGYILGVSIANEHGEKAYLNLGHYDCSESERQKNLQYLRDLFEATPETTLLLGQNLMYDLDWLINWAGLSIKGTIIDIMIAEALLDENQGRYTLDFMGTKYLNRGKEKNEVQEYCDEFGYKGDPRKWLWKMPWYIVEGYALGDTDLPLLIWEIQEKLLLEQELIDLMHLECDLMWCLLLFRKTGVRIDPIARERNARMLEARAGNYIAEMQQLIGLKTFDFKKKNHLVFAFDQLGIPYPTTEKGNPSITRDHLMAIAKGQYIMPDGQKFNDPIGIKFAADLSDLRRANTVRNNFLDGSLKKFAIDDIIHCSFYNTRTDNFGTRSGRFSSANPNLQQIPSTGVDAFYGKLARECFVPFEDHWWGKLDYSQIEYRFMAHFARGHGSADKIREAYNKNPNTDYHQYIVDLTGLKRRYAKNLNFGVAYGMGAKHMAEFFQWDLSYCYEILDIYHGNAPFIKSTIRRVEDISKRRGYIRTFLKRRSRLIDMNKAYTMFCRLIQGSAADMMKMGMHSIYKAGIFDVLAPHITVHDEIDVSIPQNKIGLEAFREMKHIMETCIDLKVPVVADMEIGVDWARLTEFKDPNKIFGLLEVPCSNRECMRL